MQLSAVCFNFAQHNNKQTLHTLENTGFKTNQFGLRKRVHLGLILPSKFDCLFNPSINGWFNSANGFIRFYYNIRFFFFFFYFCIFLLYAWNNIYRLT